MQVGTAQSASRRFIALGERSGRTCWPAFGGNQMPAVSPCSVRGACCDTGSLICPEREALIRHPDSQASRSLQGMTHRSEAEWIQCWPLATLYACSLRRGIGSIADRSRHLAIQRQTAHKRLDARPLDAVSR